MPRMELQEIHDHPVFPGFLRDLVTDALQSLWDFSNSYKPILPRLLGAMERAGTHEVLDLCSGGGGPWLRLAREPELHREPAVTVRLTDKYPNHGAFSRASAVSGLLESEAAPVDATAVSPDLGGFRTIFSAFHHLSPEMARRMLGDAMMRDRGVGIFEVARRSPKTILAICILPLLVLCLAPSIRPFRWSRLVWTYMLPIVPFVLFYDGLVSCLRCYSQKELRELVRPLEAANYTWEVGEERSGFLPVTYLLGYPAKLAIPE